MQIHTKDPVKFVVAVLAAQVMGGLVTQMSPLIVGSLIIGLELTEQQAGFVVFAEYISLSITVIVIAPFLSRLPYRSLCLSAAMIAIGAQIISITLFNLNMFIAFRCIAGIGEGLVYASSLAAVASRSTNPDKLYGYMQVTWASLSIVLFSLGGHVTEMYGHKGLYSMIALFTILLTVFFFWLPDEVTMTQETKNIEKGTTRPILGSVTLIGIFIYLVATAAVYTFTVPLGERSGLSTTEIGYALTLGSVLGVIGAGLAAWLNVRKGRFLPITVFSFAVSILAFVLCINTHPVVYVIALVLLSIFFYFSIPYLFGLAAALDNQGMWAAAAGSAYLLGFAVGPVFAGTIIEFYGYGGLGVVTAITAIIAWLLLTIVLRYLKPMGTTQ